MNFFIGSFVKKVDQVIMDPLFTSFEQVMHMEMGIEAFRLEKSQERTAIRLESYSGLNSYFVTLGQDVLWVYKRVLRECLHRTSLGNYRAGFHSILSGVAIGWDLYRYLG